MSDPVSVSTFNADQKQVIVFDTNQNGYVDEADTATAGTNFVNYQSGDRVPFDDTNYQSLRDLYSSAGADQPFQNVESSAAALGLELRREQRLRCMCPQYNVFHNGQSLGFIYARSFEFTKSEFLTKIQPLYEQSQSQDSCDFGNISIDRQASQLLAQTGWVLSGTSLVHQSGYRLPDLAARELHNKSARLFVDESSPQSIRIQLTECDDNRVDFNVDLQTGRVTPIF